MNNKETALYIAAKVVEFVARMVVVGCVFAFLSLPNRDLTMYETLREIVKITITGIGCWTVSSLIRKYLFGEN